MEKCEKVKIAEQVRVYRARRKLSQAEFGKLMGLSQRLISYIENDVFKVSDDRIQAIKTVIEQQGKGWNHE